MSVNSKLEIINSYNDLLSLATEGDSSFPDNLCNYVTTEFDFQALVLFEVLDAGGYKVIGKSANARKNYLRGSEFTCSRCKLNNDVNDFAIHYDSNC